jgi:WS/DGAT/MGAT family acyltransferase
VVLEESAEPRTPPQVTWRPAPEPSLLELVAGAVADSVRRPRQVVETVRAGVGDLRQTAAKTAETVGGVVNALGTAARPTPRSPLNRTIGPHRRVAMLATDLADYRRIRSHLLAAYQPGGGGVPAPITVTINDIVLATLAGGLRSWLLTRGVAVPPAGVVRALVPMSVRVSDPSSAGALGSRVASLLVDLPTGEPSPLVRVHQIAYQTKAHRDTGQAVDAPAIAGIAGFAPPTLHSLGARVASSLSRRLFNLVVTNVPGPQLPLYLDGSRLLSTYPVIPLARGQALSVGLTSYAGGVYYGLNADRDAMPDLEVLGHCLLDALAELREQAA